MASSRTSSLRPVGVLAATATLLLATVVVLLLAQVRPCDANKSDLLERLHAAVHAHDKIALSSNPGEIAELVAVGAVGDDDTAADGAAAPSRLGPRLNLPPGASNDFDYTSEEGKAALMPPKIHDTKCGAKAPVVPAHVPLWSLPEQPGRPEWCLSTPAAPRGPSTPTFLAAHLYVRIYAEDLSELTKLDIAHHMTYYRSVGSALSWVGEVPLPPGVHVRRWRWRWCGCGCGCCCWWCCCCWW